MVVHIVVGKINSVVIWDVEVNDFLVQVDETLTFMVGVIAASKMVICSKLKIEDRIGMVNVRNERLNGVLFVAFVLVFNFERLLVDEGVSLVLEKVARRDFKEVMVRDGIDSVRVEDFVDLVIVGDEDVHVQDLDDDHLVKIIIDHHRDLVTDLGLFVNGLKLEVKELDAVVGHIVGVFDDYLHYEVYTSVVRDRTVSSLFTFKVVEIVILIRVIVN